MNLYFYAIDPGTALGKHDHLEPDHLAIATAGTVSIHKPSISHKKQANIANNVASSSHNEDKHEQKSAIKRQRRQRQHADIKEEEKKVSLEAKTYLHIQKHKTSSASYEL